MRCGMRFRVFTVTTDRVTVVFDIYADGGWNTVVTDAPKDSVHKCYALPKVNGEAADRFAFWERETGVKLPRGHAMIWQVV